MTSTTESAMGRRLRGRAVEVAAILSEDLGHRFTFDRAGVDLLSLYIEQVRPLLAPESLPDVVTALGCFLGECLIHIYGGDWVQREDWWGIEIREGIVACPFVQVSTQLTQGAEHSLGRYLECTSWLMALLDQSDADRAGDLGTFAPGDAA